MKITQEDGGFEPFLEHFILHIGNFPLTLHSIQNFSQKPRPSEKLAKDSK